MRVLIVGAVLAAERIVAAHMVGHLHLDDIGAPVGKLPARRRSRADLGEINDTKALERGGGGLVRHVPEGLIAEWQEKRTPRHVQMSEVLRRAFSLAPKHVTSVRQSLEEIFRFRDLAMDPSAKTNTRILHPELGIGVEWRFAYFRYQNAQLIVSATLRLIAELVAWSKPEEAELREYVDALRASLDSLQGASALKSQPPDVHPIQSFPEQNSIRTARR